jgi:large subunit ribosomal protein L9
MELILMDDVEGMGQAGDVVSVADGYGRNFLLPRKLAAPVTEAARRRLARTQVERDKRRADHLTAARRTAAALEGVSVTIRARSSDGAHLYGSVGEVEIAAALAEKQIAVDKATVRLEHPIKELGSTAVKLRLHPEVEAVVQVLVVE